MDNEKNKRKAMPPFPRGILMWLLLFLLGATLFKSFFTMQFSSPHNTNYSSFKEDVELGNVEKVTMRDNQMVWETYGGRRYATQRPFGPGTEDMLQGKNVRVEELPPAESSWWRPLLWYLGPVIALFAFWYFMFRGAQGGGKIMAFGKSRARQISEGRLKITFKDVAGVDEAKEELKEIIEFLKDPKRFQKLGGKIPKGVLLMGPPGTGKTLLAKAVAGEAGVPFFSISGSDFVEMFVGVGASRVRDLFEQGKRSAKLSGKGCIIFIDEIDAVGRLRFAGIGGGHDEREQTLNALLVEMDGFDTQEGVILIAATNRPDVLDPALTRPGRFDRQVVIDRPDIAGREEILKVHVRNIKLDKEVDLKSIARKTPGFSGADIANLSNEAALLAARNNKPGVGMEELESAVERVIAGPERKSRVISPYEKKIISYHESGHAILALLVPGADTLHKVSIIPRGMALGYTMQTPTEDRYITTKKELLGKLAGMMGGRASEEIIFDELTTGAHNDLEVATQLARRMVCEWGMSEKLGCSTYGRRDGPVFLGRDIVEEKNYSEATAVAIDLEIKKIVEESYNRSKNILLENKEKLQLLAETLLGKEVMGEDEVRKLLGMDKTLPPVDSKVYPLDKTEGVKKPAETQAGNNEESGVNSTPQA